MATPFDFPPPAITDYDPDVPAATPKQESFLRDLMARKARLLGLDAIEADMKTTAWFVGMNMNQASVRIEQALAAVKELEATIPDVEDGFYLVPDIDTPIRVIHAVHGSGYQYARALNPDTNKWDMKVTGLMNMVKASGHRIDNDPDYATKLGKLYGVCMVCGTTLTDKTPGGSIELGVGPVCRANRGW